MSSVDVIVPCHNYAAFLRACVESVLDQRSVDLRVLVLDDASTDGSEAVGRALTRRDGRVEYRRHAFNRGHIATYNEGLEWVAGDYMLLLSADDLLTPGALSRAVELMDSHPDVGLTYGRAIMTSEPARHPPRIPDPCKTRVLSGLELVEAFCAWGGNRVPTQTAIVRTSVQRAVGGYRPELPHSGDMEMWLRVAARHAIGVVDADQAFYRIHPDNMHKRYVAAVLDDLEEYRRTFQGYFEREGRRLPQAEQLLAMALGSLARRALWKASAFLDQGDARGYAGLLAFAARISPPIRRDPLWRRMRIKRAAGPLWSIVRGSLRRTHGATDDPEWSRVGLFPEM